MEQAFLLFHCVSLGRSSWTTGRMAHWRERVGDWWEMSAGQINQETQRAIESMCRFLNEGRSAVADVAPADKA